MSDSQPDFTRLAELAAGLGLHQHLCLIYDTREEQFAAALPYLRTGLERGEKCLYVVDENTAAAVLDALRKSGTDVDRYLRSGALTLAHKQDTYLKQGRFDPDWMIDFLTQAIAEAGAAGCCGLRTLLGEMTWVLGSSDATDKLIEYESKLNRFIRNHDARLICQYHRTRFPPELILAVIRTHPLVVYGGVVCRNPYYVPPEEFLKPNQAAQEVERLLSNILAWERAQQALRQSGERWRAVFENSAVGIALTDCISTRFQAANFAFQKMVGYPEGELRALTFMDITYEDDREPNRKLLSELLEGRRHSFAMEKRYRRKDQSLIWVNLHVSLVPGSASIPRFSLAIVEDITERKRAEEALRRSEAYLVAGQRLSHTGSWAWNVRSGEMYWSRETYRIFGFDPATTTAGVNETFLPRIHPEDRPRIEKGIKAAAIQKGAYGIDYRIVLPDGAIKHIHDVVYPVTGETGDVVERYGVIMDVTERRGAEEALQKSRDQLRALAARLQSVREEERTKVAREIHDELGQALTAIRISLSSWSRDLVTDKKQESEPILKLVDETIQSVRRISTELRPAILDALGLVAAVEWAAGEFEARTGIKCRLDLPTNDIVIDQERATALFRIFQETLTNVARHANASEVEVRLAKGEGNLTLEVHDNGKGITGEPLLSATSLGILGMQERALLLGGDFAIVSSPGEGTTVRVRIPETHLPPPKDGK